MSVQKPTRDIILEKIEAFLRRTGMSENQFGMLIAKEGRIVQRIRDGHGVTLTLIERAEKLMAEHDAAAAQPQRRAGGRR